MTTFLTISAVLWLVWFALGIAACIGTPNTPKGWTAPVTVFALAWLITRIFFS